MSEMKKAMVKRDGGYIVVQKKTTFLNEKKWVVDEEKDGELTFCCPEEYFF